MKDSNKTSCSNCERFIDFDDLGNNTAIVYCSDGKTRMVSVDYGCFYAFVEKSKILKMRDIIDENY